MPSTADASPGVDPPVQLELSYRSPDALVTAYTASVSKGGFVFLSDRALAVGRRFEFRLKVEDEPTPVSLLGLVVRSKAVGAKHQVAVQYLPEQSSRRALGVLLARMQVTESEAPVRQEPRIPVNLIARDALLPTRTFLVENLSHGGMGVSLTQPELRHLAVGAACALEVQLLTSATIVLRGRIAWLDRDTRRGGARFGVSFHGLAEAEHLVVAGMLQLFRPQGLLLAVGEGQAELFSAAPSRPRVVFDAEELVALISAQAQRFFEHLTGQTCHAVRRPASAEEPSTSGRLALSADLTGDVDIELTLYAERPSLEFLARSAGFDGADLETACDSGRELLSTLAGQVADELERMELREEVLPHRSGEPLSARRPFDRRELFEIFVGGEVVLLEALLRLQTLAR